MEIKSSHARTFDNSPSEMTILNCLKYIERDYDAYFNTHNYTNYMIVEFEADKHGKQRKFVRVLK